jgi:dynein intermediate chain 2
MQSVPTGDEEAESQWVRRLTTTVELDCIPQMAQHEANTEMFVTQPAGTCHIDGAWPAEVKTTEFKDRDRLLRRIKNEAGYQSAVMNLIKTAEVAISQNNTIDLFEDYFQQVEQEYATEPPACKTVAVFRDPNEIKRAATKISWHPELANKVAVSYSILQFQQMPDKMPITSYIWDVNNPNQPDATISPQSPLCCLVYNPRSPDHLVGGSYNGMVGFWDLRKGSQPVTTSVLEKSHHDPVYDLFWTQSRTGTECCSISTDGQLLWWDTRKLDAGPTDSMMLESPNDTIYGGTCLEYKSDAGATRYLVGTEQGLTLMIDRKAKKDAESTKSIKTTFGLTSGKHHGPVNAIARNPGNMKYFMTVGDWTARIWFEDLKSPLMTTPFDGSYLTSGCWSPTRHGVFFTTKADGTMDVWDYHYKQNEPTFSTKVSECPLTSIRVQSHGELVAIGSDDGTTTILQLNRALSELQHGEKASMAVMLDRETRREKNLDGLQKKKDHKTGGGGGKKEPTAEEEEANKEVLRRVEEEFYSIIDKEKAKADKKDAAAAAAAADAE